MWIFALLMLIAFEAIADIFSKEYSLHGKLWYWLLAIGGYIIANVFWLYSIRRGSGLARGAILFSIGSAVAAVLLGTLRYQEKIGKVEMVGVAIGIVAIILIFWSDIVALAKG